MSRIRTTIQSPPHVFIPISTCQHSKSSPFIHTISPWFLHLVYIGNVTLCNFIWLMQATLVFHFCKAPLRCRCGPQFNMSENSGSYAHVLDSLTCKLFKYFFQDGVLCYK